MNASTPKEPSLGPDQTLVAVRPDGTVWSSEARGIKPLLDALENHVDLRGARCRDKIVGRAAAFLFVRAGVASVGAPVMANGATRLLAKHGISWKAESLVDKIMNRAQTGSCPMEAAVAAVSDDDPEAAERILRETLARLSAKRA